MMRVWYRLIWSAAALEGVAAAALVVYLCVRAKPATAIEPRATQAIVAGRHQKNEPIVCTMRTDSYYHRRSCRYLSSSKIAMPLTSAQLHHRPCSRCKPPH